MAVSTLIIDGGGTTTDVAIVRTGQVRARTELAAYKPRRSENRTDELCRAIGAFLATAQLPHEETEIKFCIIGMSGIWSDNEQTQYANAFSDAWMQYVDHALPAVRVISDVELALTAALGGDAGTIVIAGTGSIAVTRLSDAHLVRCGGWGPRLDDEGGGFWMGREALRAVARMLDNRGQETLLVRPVAAYLRCDPNDTVALEANLRSVSIDSAARLARAVLTYAEEGDAVAQNIAERGAVALHAIVHPLLTNMSVPGVAHEVSNKLVLHGSLFANDFYRGMVERLVRSDHHDVDIVYLDDLVAAIAPQLHAG